MPSKFDAARRLTAALSYIALANLDAVNIHFFADTLLDELGITRGKSQFHSVLNFLRDEPRLTSHVSRLTSLLATARAFTQRAKRRGLVFILSDFFDPAGYDEPLAQLRHAQFEVHVLQILDPAELAPADTGDLRLLETETGAALEITASDSLLRRYREQIETFNATLERHCLERAIAHARVTCDVPFEDVVLRVLRNGVMLK